MYIHTHTPLSINIIDFRTRLFHKCFKMLRNAYPLCAVVTIGFSEFLFIYLFQYTFLFLLIACSARIVDRANVQTHFMLYVPRHPKWVSFEKALQFCMTSKENTTVLCEHIKRNRVLKSFTSLKIRGGDYFCDVPRLSRYRNRLNI